MSKHLITLLSFILSFSLTSCSTHNLHSNRGPALDEIASFQSLSKATVGVYTGSFDPPTNSHKKIMTTALENYPIKKLLIFVNVSGSKDFKSSFAERKAMILGMLGADAEKVEVRPVLRENVNETMEALNKKSLTVQFIGQDSFEALPEESMMDPNRRWAVIPRGHEPLHIPEKANAEALPPIDDTSSSQIRALIKENRINEANIDPFVRDYILKSHLYLSLEGEAEVQKMKDYETLFKEYKKAIKKARPGLDVSDFPIPEYLSEQSISAWSDKFTNAMIKREKFTGSAAEDFRIFSQGVLSKLSLQKNSHQLESSSFSCSPEIIKIFVK